MEERTVGPYRVLRRIGDRGGMAVVYLARAVERLGRVVALKELDLRAPDPKVVERFIEEARIARSLRHPNIVAVHDFFEFDGVPYISMEFVERGSLRRYVGTLTLAQTFGCWRACWRGSRTRTRRRSSTATSSPRTCWSARDGAVKIADFGIARALRRVTSYTGTGITVGTPAYMAPEQAMALTVTPATDLHSVGVIAFELLSGQLPMSADAPMALMLRKVHESSPFAALGAAGVDPRLNALIGRLLARVPDDRPQSAQRDLGRVRGDRGVAARAVLAARGAAARAGRCSDSSDRGAALDARGVRRLERGRSPDEAGLRDVQAGRAGAAARRGRGGRSSQAEAAPEGARVADEPRVAEPRAARRRLPPPPVRRHRRRRRSAEPAGGDPWAGRRTIRGAADAAAGDARRR